MIGLAPHPAGTILPVRAQPGARRNALEGIREGQLRVSVTQAAEKGKANQAIVGLLCKVLGLRRSQVELLSGESSRQKRFLVRGMTPDELAQRIAEALAGPA